MLYLGGGGTHKRSDVLGIVLQERLLPHKGGGGGRTSALDVAGIVLWERHMDILVREEGTHKRSAETQVVWGASVPL